jgi:hypothetical protein
MNKTNGASKMLENGLKVGDLAWYVPYSELRHGCVVKIEEIDNTKSANVIAVPFPINHDNKIVSDFGSRFMPLFEAELELKTMLSEVKKKYDDLRAVIIALELD